MKEKTLTIINYILIAILFVVSSYLASGLFIFDADHEQDIKLWAVIVSLSLIAISLSLLLIINIKKKKYKPNYILLGVLSVLFIAGLFTLIFIKDRGIYQYPGVDGTLCEFEYHITPLLRFTYISELLAYLILGLLILDIIYQVVDGKQCIKIASYLVLTIIVVLMVISYFKDANKYVEVVKHLTRGEFYENAVASVVESKNNYAYILTLGIFACIILHYFDKKWYWLAGLGFIYLNMVFTLCKWLLFLDAIAVLGYLLYRFMVTRKENKKRNIIALCAIAGTMIVGIATLFIILAVNDKLANIADAITKQNGVDTLDARFWIWRRAILAIENGNWFTGAGFNLFGQLLFRYNTYDVITQFANNTRSAHNGYLQYIGDGGILLLLAALVIAAMLVLLSVKNMQKDRDLMVISLGILVFSLIYMIIESGTIILPRSMENATLAILAITPILALNKEKAN